MDILSPRQKEGSQMHPATFSCQKQKLMAGTEEEEEKIKTSLEIPLNTSRTHKNQTINLLHVLPSIRGRERRMRRKYRCLSPSTSDGTSHFTISKQPVRRRREREGCWRSFHFYTLRFKKKGDAENEIIHQGAEVVPVSDGLRVD